MLGIIHVDPVRQCRIITG